MSITQKKFLRKFTLQELFLCVNLVLTTYSKYAIFRVCPGRHNFTIKFQIALIQVWIAIFSDLYEVLVNKYWGIIFVNFGEMLEKLKNGSRAARKGWNGKGIFIRLQNPNQDSEMSHPYIYIDTTGLQSNNSNAPKSRVPWIASQTDILSEDWTLI